MHCLTIDVEEHFQVSAFDSLERRGSWPDQESRVEANTRRVLELLERRGIHATFFVLGWVAERHPRLVREIAAAGHEIASHGHEHRMITDLDPATFREDVRRAKALLEDVLGEPVLGYRAPSFTVTPKTVWALPILVEEGYRYDSSIVPIVHDRYGFPGANPAPHVLETASGPLWEFPPATTEIAGFRLPVGGGGYLRLYPFPFFRWLARRAAAERPLVLFVHPWELDTEQPRMNGSALSRFRHYFNLAKTEPRLGHLLEEFRFEPVRSLLATLAQPA